MKIVIDANLFISAFFWQGNPKKVIDRVVSKLDDLFISIDILDEISDVINRPKFKADKKETENYISEIKRIANNIDISEHIDLSRDKKDNKYIDCAIAADADFIVSGDTHLLELKEYGKIKIVKAKEYLDKCHK
jgi:putative PIN family toxin of toxin-antitoxin system